MFEYKRDLLETGSPQRASCPGQPGVKLHWCEEGKHLKVGEDQQLQKLPAGGAAAAAACERLLREELG